MKKEENFTIKKDDTVIFNDMRTVVEVKKSNIKKRESNIKYKRILANYFVDVYTGEIKEFDMFPNEDERKKRSRGNNKNTSTKSAKHFKELIITNFNSIESTSFITLKFNNLLSDRQEAIKFFKSFIKSVKRNFKDEEIRYVYSLEFGAVGNLHIHAVIFWTNKTPYDFSTKIHKLWKKGEADCKVIKQPQDITYIAVYMTMGVTVDKGNTSKNEITKDKEDKLKVKNARLDDFPMYARYVIGSKNLIKPTKTEMTYAEALDIIGHKDPFSKRSLEKDLNSVYIKQFYEYYLR